MCVLMFAGDVNTTIRFWMRLFSGWEFSILHKTKGGQGLAGEGAECEERGRRSGGVKSEKEEEKRRYGKLIENTFS